MNERKRFIHLSCIILMTLAMSAPVLAQGDGGPAKIYVPYEKLKAVFEAVGQGVFLPYDEFQRLWRAAQGDPAGVEQAPMPYLISTARFSGQVDSELASMHLQLTVDILIDGWVEVPIGLADVAVAEASFAGRNREKVRPLLRVVNGKYILLTKGKGRYVLEIEFVRQLVKKTGLQVLSFRMPRAAINTLELIIPEENMKVDVEPMLAASTSQITRDGAKVTKLQTFLGAADHVRLSWKPRTQAAAQLEPVIIADQLQHIHIAEALINYDVQFTYNIRRRGVDSFAIQLPGDFRVTGVDGANIARWDIEQADADAAPRSQLLKVKLFSLVKDNYKLSVKMEKFLKESEAAVDLSPILTQQVLRRTGLVAISRSSRRSVELTGLRNLARVDTGRLPQQLRSRKGVMVYRFITADYGGVLSIGTVDPRITVDQSWSVHVFPSEKLRFKGQMQYHVDRVGIFEMKINLPERWYNIRVHSKDVVEDYRIDGKGDQRTLNILLKKERTGQFTIDISAYSSDSEPDQKIRFSLPSPDKRFLDNHYGHVVLTLPDELSAEVGRLDQMQSIPLKKAGKYPSIRGKAAMAFKFHSPDLEKPLGGEFKIAVKPTQVSAVVHRLVDVQPGAIRQEAIIDYRILYAPVNTLYLKMPATLADEGVQIDGANIKEKPRIDELPADQKPKNDEVATDGTDWAYYKIVLQSPVKGNYRLKVSTRRGIAAVAEDAATKIIVEPILAAGKLSDQSGYIAIAKADTLVITEPETANLTPADPAGKTDLPYGPHRKIASLAFKYSTTPFKLSFGAIKQTEAAVITTMASGAVIEQVLARDGTLNTHATFLIQTRRGDRLAVTMPDGAKLFAIMINGEEAPVESGASADQQIVRLPPSAGQVTKIVLEISYSLDGASSSKLEAPKLPSDVPVQQMLWRVWLPDELTVLAHDRDFAVLTRAQSDRLLRQFAAGQPSAVAFKLAPQGRQVNFIRQGAAGRLSITTAGRELFSILVWVIVAAAGVAMLKLRGFHRSVIILSAALVAAAVKLFAPLAVIEIVHAGKVAAVLVALLWLAQWVFFRLKLKRASPPSVESSLAETATQTDRDKE